MLLSVWSLLVADSRLVEEALMLLARSLRLLMMGWNEPLAPVKYLQILDAVSDIIVLSDKSVSKIETAWMASSKVLGIFCASVMWSNVVARLWIIIGCCSGMRFLLSINWCTASGVLEVVLSKLVNWVGWELVQRSHGLRAGVNLLLGLVWVTSILGVGQMPAIRMD